MEFTYASGNYLISACSENKGSLSVEAKQLTVISTLNVCVRNDEEKLIELERKKKIQKINVLLIVWIAVLQTPPCKRTHKRRWRFSKQYIIVCQFFDNFFVLKNHWCHHTSGQRTILRFFCFFYKPIFSGSKSSVVQYCPTFFV